MVGPELPYQQLRCSAAKAKKASLPAALGDLSKLPRSVLNVEQGKLTDGTRLIHKFCVPRNPTKGDPSLRLYPDQDPEDGPKFYEYNLRDIEAESEISEQLPDLSPHELALWLLDQKINIKGARIDVERLGDCLDLMGQVFRQYEAELVEVTGGQVRTINQFEALATWLTANGCPTKSVKEEVIDALILDQSIQGPARRVLEIRQILAYSSVKKAVAIKLQLDDRERLQGLFSYCGALRTDRWSGMEALKWLARCAEHGNAIALIFARTETSLFFEHVWGRADGLLFLQGRLYFHHANGEVAKANSGAPSVLVAYGTANSKCLKNCGINGAWLDAKEIIVIGENKPPGSPLPQKPS